MEVTTPQSIDLSQLDAVLEKREGERGSLIPILQETQEAYGYLAARGTGAHRGPTRRPFQSGVRCRDLLRAVLSRPGADETSSRSATGQPATFVGPHATCRGAEKDLGVGPGQTTEDYQFTYEVVYSSGRLRPRAVMAVQGRREGRCSPDKVHRAVSELVVSGTDGEAGGREQAHRSVLTRQC